MSEPPAERRTPVRYIKPLGPRILVRVRPMEGYTKSGLILPPGVREAEDVAAYGEVVEVARAEAGEELGANVSGVPHGALVLFAKEAGLRVPWDDKLRLVQVKDVFAVVEEVAPTALQ